MKYDISKNTKMVAPNGISDFEIMAISLTNVNIPKKVTSLVA